MSSAKIIVLRELALVGGGFLASGALAYAAVKTWNKLKPTCFALCKISQAKTVPISDLRSLISSDSCESEYKSSEEMLVIVRGVVEARSRNYLIPDVLVSQVSGEKCVVVEQTWGCFTYLEFFKLLLEKAWTFERKTSSRKIPFMLSESGSSNHVFVNLDGSSHPLPLKLVYDFYRKKFSDNCRPIRFALNPEFLIEEKILPIGKEISAVGICSLQDGNPQIKACEELPYFLSELTRDEMVKWLIDKRNVLILGSVLLGALSFDVLLHTCSRSWHMWKKWKKQVNENVRDGTNTQDGQ